MLRIIAIIRASIKNLHTFRYYQTFDCQQISGSSCGNHVCCGGLSGIPGIPGTPGRAGEAGRDGRDGAPGTFGPQGRTGRRGSASPVGPKGEQGTRGQQGTRGPPGPGAHANWKECTWKNLNDGRDHGKVVVSGPWS